MGLNYPVEWEFESSTGEDAGSVHTDAKVMSQTLGPHKDGLIRSSYAITECTRYRCSDGVCDALTLYSPHRRRAGLCTRQARGRGFHDGQPRRHRDAA